MYALKEEKLLLEVKLAQMKKEIQKSIILNLTMIKDTKIRNLTADKKKLKSSLIKASDKLNERDAEIENLNETLQCLEERLNDLNDEKTELQNNLDAMTRNEEELNRERLDLAENIGNVSEYLNSVILENAYLAEEVIVYEAKENKLKSEIISLKDKILEEKVLFDELLSEKRNLVNIVDNLKETATLLTEELNQYKSQCSEKTVLKQEIEVLVSKLSHLNEAVNVFEEEKACILGDMSSLSETISSLLIDQSTEITVFKQENEALVSKVNHLNETVNEYEGEKACILVDMSSLSETISSLLIDSQLLSDQLKVGSEMSKDIELLIAEKDKLEQRIVHYEENNLVLLQSNSTLQNQLENAKDKDIIIKELEDFAKGLEAHLSSLNEELMSEIYKNQSLTVTKAEFERKLSQSNEEILILQNRITSLVEQLNESKEKNNVINGLEQLVTDLEHHMSSLNEELMSEIAKNHFLSVENENLECQQKTFLEEKMLENEHLTQVAEAHKCCLDTKNLLENEKSNLETQVKALTESLEELHSEQHQLDTLLTENLKVKDVMAKEIHSLTGEIWDCKVEPLIDVYQKLMKEFLNKEKEVIFSLQNDCEIKIKVAHDEIVGLRRGLNEKEVLTSKLENEVEECKLQLNQRDSCISGLENELITIKNKVNSRANEIEEIKLQAEKEKESLISELNRVQCVETNLEENVSILSNEINCKNNEILQLKNDLEKMHYENTNLLRQTEEEGGVSKRQKDLIDELSSSLNDKQELISQLNLQLQNKNNEVNQLTVYLEKKEIEARQYLMRIEEMKPAELKLHTIEKEVDLIKNSLASLDEEFDGGSFVGSLQTYQVLGDIMTRVVSKFISILNQVQNSNDNLKLELSKQSEVCKSLETQISEMNEELKSHKLLYDEDSLQFKEEIAGKNVIIANLTEALEELKSKACSEAENTEMKNIKEQLLQLKEENEKLLDEATKIPYLTGVNRKLSWEIEELSRSIKFEKQSNTDLKAKYNIASNQVADLSKKNYLLEDKIDVLESKINNYDVISSLKIVLPLGIDTVDKQVQYLNEKLAECDVINSKLNNLIDEHSSLKLEHEKSKEYIKKQEEKLCKIMKRELELKKQIASNLQTSPDLKILKGLKSELLSLFPDQNLFLTEVLLKIKTLVKEGKEVCNNNPEIQNLKQKIEELSEENRELDVECEMMNKHIKEQEELLTSVFKREEELKKLNVELKSQLPNQMNTDLLAVEEDVKELFGIFPEKPVSIKDSINLVKLMLTENQNLKEKIAESQEEYASLDKECEDMFKAYQIKEKDLADVLKREAIFKDKQHELECELKALSQELQEVKSQAARNNPTDAQASCQCEELKSRLSELKVVLAERNAKITALELQFEADNFPLKKKVADLEKSLDQAKHKVNELKSEVRRYQEQMCDVTVGLRAECERCRTLGTAADPAPATALTVLQQQLQKKDKEISILKALCKTRNQRIKELEEQDSSYKMPRPQRSALKEGKENKTVPPSPTKPSKSSLQ